MKTVNVICAWCNKKLGTVESNNGDSHGICFKCWLRLKIVIFFMRIKCVKK